MIFPDVELSKIRIVLIKDQDFDLKAYMYSLYLMAKLKNSMLKPWKKKKRRTNTIQTSKFSRNGFVLSLDISFQCKYAFYIKYCKPFEYCMIIKLINISYTYIYILYRPIYLRECCNFSHMTLKPWFISSIYSEVIQIMHYSAHWLTTLSILFDL